MSRTQERVLRQAEFSDQVTKYHLLNATAVISATVVGIPFLIVVLPAVKWYYDRYYARLSVSITNRDLKVHRGILNREEKTIPLEKITDLRVYQGPIMRHMGLKGLAVETAGQTNDTGALIALVGIEDTDGFRDTALTQRDRVSDTEDDDAAGARGRSGDGVEAPATATAGGASDPGQAAVLETLTDIRDTLRRMDEKLGRALQESSSSSSSGD